MKIPSVPNVVTAALVFGCMTLLSYLQGHFAELGIPPIYAPIGFAILAIAMKMLKEFVSQTLPEVSAAPRGLDGDPVPPSAGYWHRVFLK